MKPLRSNREYDVFISHSTPEIAKLMRSRISRVGTPPWRFENLRVFLDLEQTRTGDPLSESIAKGIQRSKYFLLLASRAAARSTWVSKEVSLWLATKPASRILIVVLDGSIEWDKEQNDFNWSTTDCLPRVLSCKYGSQPCWGSLEHFSPKARKRRDQRLEDVVASIAARVLDIPKHKILNGEKRRWHRRTGLAATIVTCLIISIILLLLLTARVRRIPADNLYNDGRTLIEQRRNLVQVREALEKLRSALNIDGHHQGALLAKAFALTLLVGYGGSANPAQTHEEAEQALLSVDDTETSEYYHVKGRLVLFKDKEPSLAAVLLEKAVALDPSNIEALHSLANAYTFLGKHEQAEALCLKAIEIAEKLTGGRKDKRFTRSQALLAWAYIHAGKYEIAEALCLKILETEDSTYDLANRYLGQIYTRWGIYDKAIDHFQSAGGDAIENTNLYANMTCAIALAGRRDEAHSRINRLLARRTHGAYVSHYRLAQCYASLGETDMALAELREAREDRGDVFVLWSAVDPLLSSLLGNPEFDKYLKSLGLPAATRQMRATRERFDNASSKRRSDNQAPMTK